MELKQARPMPFAMPPQRTALMMIDMQRDFIQKGGYGYLQCSADDVIFNEVAKIIEPCKQVLQACRKMGITVIHTREGHEPDLRDLAPSKRLRQYRATPEKYELLIGDEGPMGRLLVRGEYGHDLVDDLAPIEGEIVIDKPGKGTFFNTDVHQILVTRGITHILMCGVTTECCVNTTFREANDHGFECCTLADCTNGFDAGIVDKTLATFCAYDGLLGYVGVGKELVELAEAAEAKQEPGSGFEFEGYDLDDTSAVAKKLCAVGGTYKGQTDSTSSSRLVVAVDDGTIDTTRPIFTCSSGMVSLAGTSHTMFGSVAFVCEDMRQTRACFANVRGFDPQDGISRHHYEYPMKPVDFRGIGTTFLFAATVDELPPGFDKARQTQFDWDAFHAIYEFRDLLDAELYHIGKAKQPPQSTSRYMQLLQARQKVVGLFQPRRSPHVIVSEASAKLDTIVRLLGFPSYRKDGLVYISEFGLDGVLLDICSA